ncbi:hypothetical protein [Cedecea davisae]|uniref:hypothetical protein n=1 Tax=Cedecea davisae TaxID=158484 RepID=UPI00242F51FF|nr:hypothetical protein [Cedecea davisae]
MSDIQANTRKLTAEEYVKFKNTPPVFLGDVGLNTDPLVFAGTILQFGASQIPVAGAVAATLLKIFWPVDKTDVWQSIASRVKSLVDDEIDSEQQAVLQNKTNEMQDKIDTYSGQLARHEYDVALNTFNALITYFDAIEDNFKLVGHNFPQSFTPVFAAAINLKIAFYVDSYAAKDELGLSSNQVNDICNMLTSTVAKAKTYLYDLEYNVLHREYALNQRYEFIEFCSYYYKNVIYIANNMWKEDIQEYIDGFNVNACRIPIFAVGDWTNSPYPALDFTTFAQCIQCGCNTEQDYKDDSGYLVNPPISPLSGATNLTEISVFHDEASDGRCTGISYKVDGDSYSQKNIELGKTDKTLFDPDYKVTCNTAEFGSQHISKISVWASAFVSYVGFYSLEGESLEGGQYTSRDTQYDVTIPQPFKLCTITGPSDIGPYQQGTGHQLAAFGVGAIYDNDLAKKMVQNQTMTLFNSTL